MRQAANPFNPKPNGGSAKYKYNSWWVETESLMNLSLLSS